MRWKDELPPINFDSELFSDFLDRLEEYSEVEQTTVTVNWNGGDTEVQFNEIRKILEDQSLPDRILSYKIAISTKEGQIRVIADGQGANEVHQLSIQGPDAWVKTNIQNITSLLEARKSTLRSVLSRKNLFFLQMLLIGSLASIFLPYGIAILHPMTHLPVPERVLWLSVSQFLLLGFLEVPKRLYPYVVIRRNGVEPLYRRVLSILIPLLTIVSVALSAVSLLTSV